MKFALPSTVKLMDCVGKHINYKVVGKQDSEGNDLVKSKSVFMFAVQNAIDKRSYIKFYKFTNKHLNFQFEKETMFSDPIESLAEIDPTRSIYAIIFGGTSSGFAIVRADFEDFKLVVLSNNLQNSGIRIQKILSLDNENYILIYGERFVQDSRDVQQSVLIR